MLNVVSDAILNMLDDLWRRWVAVFAVLPSVLDGRRVFRAKSFGSAGAGNDRSDHLTATAEPCSRWYARQGNKYMSVYAHKMHFLFMKKKNSVVKCRPSAKYLISFLAPCGCRGNIVLQLHTARSEQDTFCSRQYVGRYTYSSPTLEHILGQKTFTSMSSRSVKWFWRYGA